MTGGNTADHVLEQIRFRQRLAAVRVFHRQLGTSSVIDYNALKKASYERAQSATESKKSTSSAYAFGPFSYFQPNAIVVKLHISRHNDI